MRKEERMADTSQSGGRGAVGVRRQDKQQQQEVAKELLAQCRWLEDNIDSNGPFLMGEQFSLVVRRCRRLRMQRHAKGPPCSAAVQSLVLPLPLCIVHTLSPCLHG